MKKQILIIDDDAAVRESLKQILEEAGHTVVVAADGTAGAKVLNAARPNLLVLDLDMPGLDGFDLLDLSSQWYPALPVMILTGLSDQCVPGALAGADALVEKPPDVPMLLQTIERLLAESPEARLRRICSTGTQDSNKSKTNRRPPRLPAYRANSIRQALPKA